MRSRRRVATALTDEQQARARGRCCRWPPRRHFHVALVHGVTGSGKTEVYLRLADAVRQRGRGVLMLVPEIALTPQVAALFRARFGAGVAIQHSGLSDGERHDQWHRIRRGDVDVVIGTRSAVFAPLANPGLIIVDEEHDTSYKQDETPRYHGRDVAIMRGKFADALVVIGSATPTIESYANALDGPLHAGRRWSAACSIGRWRACASSTCARRWRRPVDGRRAEPTAGRRRCGERLDRGEQSLILLNRRGFATAVFCRQCGATLECPNCSISLTVHARGHHGTGSADDRRGWRARCHYCNFYQARSRRPARSARRPTWSASASAPSVSRRRSAQAVPDGAHRARRSRHGAAKGQSRGDAREGSRAARSTSWSARR